MKFKKILILNLLAMALLSLAPISEVIAAAPEENIVDDSLKDISMVVGAGVVGAILGLSTLSFVNNPSKHMKNIAVGGAVGIVIGVGVVVFSQATKSTSTMAFNSDDSLMTPDKFANMTRHEFSEERIAKNYYKTPDLGYSFSF